MVTDKVLEELKKKSIDELTLPEKFTLIQNRFGQTSVDYKNRWWLDILFDSHIAQICGYRIFAYKNTTRVVILNTSDFDNDNNVEYLSELDNSSRHDAMLNAVTKFSQLDA